MPSLLAASPTVDVHVDPYGPEANAGNFDLPGWLGGFDLRLLGTAEGRRTLTRYDPLLFAAVYLRQHIKTDGVMSFADPHLEWVRYARRAWPHRSIRRAGRRAFVAPRDTGKSTWWFLILPMWAAAHGHLRFIAAFAHSGPQAELHLHTFRQELADNQLLRRDYPDLCTAARKPNGKTTADNIQMLRTRAGFTFAARGIDAANLGLKVDELRPELLLLDDIEPDEASYSLYQMKKRLGTVTDAILPMNLRAHVVLVGTVTMAGSIVHQLVRSTQVHDADDQMVEDWIADERFVVHHTLPVVPGPDGERSIWPQKWPLSFLRTIRHTRTYAKNFLNDPMGIDGDYWNKEDFTHGDLPGVTYQILSVDPKIAMKKRTDPAGFAVIGYAPGWYDEETGRRVPARCSVDYATSAMVVGDALRTYALGLVSRYPRIRGVVIEANQGGENWHAVLHHFPVPVRVVYSTAPKEVRAANLLELYQVGRRVVHARRLPELETQMVGFPKAGHDDLVDAVGAVVLRLLGPKKKTKTEVVYPR